MAYPDSMDQIVRKHERIDAADPNCVIVTLFRCDHDFVRGWYIGPPSFDADVPMSWHTGPADNMLGPIAIVRAMEIARKLNRQVCVVDPDHLWDEMHGRGAARSDVRCLIRAERS